MAARRPRANASAALENAADDLEDANLAASEGDDEELERLLHDAQNRLKDAEEAITWLKAQNKTQSDHLAALTNSTLAQQSSELSDLKAKYGELLDKLNSLTRPPAEPPATPEPTLETPEVAAATLTPEPPADPARAPSASIPAEAPKKTKRFI